VATNILLDQRTPKMKEEKVGKGSTPSAARELDFVSKTKLVICTSTKKDLTQPSTFDNTKASTGSKVVIPHWGDLYRKINQEDYPGFTPHSNPDIRILDDQVFPNINRSYLNRMDFRTPVLPCIKILGWIIHHAYMVKCTINNAEGECVGVFLPIEVQNYYKLRDPKERLNTYFVVKFYEYHDTNMLLASWWKEDKKFTNRNIGWYNTINLKETYMYLMALICRLYGENDC
jgi:hypothetical protein